MPEFPFFGKKEKQQEVKKPQMIIRIKPNDKRTMEEICEENGIKFTSEYVNGLYEFSIDEELYPRIEKYFMPPDEDETEVEEEPPKEKKEQKLPGLGDQIGAAQRKSGGNYQPEPPRRTPPSGTGSGRPTPTYTPPSTPPRQENYGRQSTIDKPREQRQTTSYTPPQNDFVRNVEAAARGELPPRTAPKSPPKVEPKDLTKDFGVLTLEEQKRLDERQAKSEAEKKPKKKRVKTGRDNQVKTRLTDTEMQLFSERVKASGMKQGDFMRECLLHEEVHVRSLTDIDAQAFGKLMEMSSDLGRIGGLIKGTVMVNKDEFGILTPTEKEKLEALIRELNTVKDDLLKVVQNLYGDS